MQTSKNNYHNNMDTNILDSIGTSYDWKQKSDEQYLKGKNYSKINIKIN